ncbi:MAG: hypothetical protein GQ547_02020 [Methylophaga sp.]|nr:hypothetical protein [Methylophaga sp.]
MRYILCLLFFVSITVSADDDGQWLDSLQLHGFASQGLVFTTDNNFYGDSEHGSAAFTELGINASLQLSSKFRVAGQLLSRHAGDMDNGSPRLDYALLDINLISSMKGRLGLYLGRIKNPLGLYNDTRDIAHTRQGVFTSQVIYFDKVRDLTMSADGVHLYGEYILDKGTLLIQAGLGYPIPDENVEITYLGQNWAGSLESNRPAMVGRVMYEHDGGRWIFALSGASLELDFNAGAADAIPIVGVNSGTLEIDYSVLSAQFNGEKWQFTSELAIQKASYIGIGGLFSDADTKPLGFMVEANYKWSPRWQTYIRNELFYLDREDKSGSEFNKQLQALSDSLGGALPVLPAHTRYSRSWIIGTRWDFNKNLMVRADYHFNKGTAYISAAENDMTSVKENWDMFALSLSYRF